MEELKRVETIIRTNEKYELVKIDKEYKDFKSIRLEIRDKDGIYNRGLCISLDEAIEIFDTQYN